MPEGHPPLQAHKQGIGHRADDRSHHDRPQTSGMFMRVASVEMRKPRPTVGEPKNSATMAPISASVALTLSAPKMNGMAAGRRRTSSVRP
jgi:hypothetical protein